MMTHSKLFPAALLLMAAACTNRISPAQSFQEEAQPNVQMTLNVSVEGGDVRTKTYTATVAAEEKLQNFQVLAFNTDANGSPTTSSTYYEAPSTNGVSSFTTTFHPGVKRMLAIANCSNLGPDTVSGWSSLGNVVWDSHNWITRNFIPLGKGFLEEWKMTVAEGENKTVEVQLKHLVARVALTSVINELSEDYGDPVASTIALINVPNGLKMDGTVKEEPYYNPWGGDYSVQANCTAGPASFKTLEYKYGSLQPSTLYSFPGQKLYLMVAVNFRKGSVVTPYYYAVPLKGLEMDHTYDVVLRLRNLGSTDPQNPAVTYPSTFSVTVGPWTPADTIDEMM